MQTKPKPLKLFLVYHKIYFTSGELAEWSSGRLSQHFSHKFARMVPSLNLGEGSLGSRAKCVQVKYYVVEAAIYGKALTGCHGHQDQRFL